MIEGGVNKDDVKTIKENYIGIKDKEQLAIYVSL